MQLYKVRKVSRLISPSRVDFVPPPLLSCSLFFFKETIKLTDTEVIVLGCLRAIHHPVVFRLILACTELLLLLHYVFFYLKMEE